jgi:hypothetical protein
MRRLAFLFLALTAGCASLTKPTAEALPAAAGPEKAPAAAPPAVAGPVKPPPEKKPAPRAPAPASSTTPAAAAAPAPALSATPGAPPSAGPRLDLKGLEQRLRDTRAIGVFTKLSLKNKVDDLLAKFRAYHDGRQPPTLTDLRPNYELLIMKVQSLIQKDDPTLSDDVARSREAIWSVLADKSKFTSI